MIRIILKIQDTATAVNVGGAEAVISHRTFEIDAPDLESFLYSPGAYRNVSVVGAEVVRSAEDRKHEFVAEPFHD